MHTPQLPKGYNTVNPFIITKDAPKLVTFLQDVFGVVEDPVAHTMDADGLLLHAELVIGNSRIAVADRKPDWPFTPSLLQIYVDDVDAVLNKAKERGAEIVTTPTDFYGDTFSRFIDPWSNLWWVYQHNPQSDAQWDEQAADTESWEPSKEMEYIHDTLLTAMKKLKANR